MTHGFLLDGKWITQGESISIHSPFDGVVVGTTFRPSSADLEAAISSSVRAFETTRKMPSYERQRILRAVSAKLIERREEFARCIALEAGKPIRTARAEVDRAILTFGVAAEESTRIGGEWLPLDVQAATAGRSAIVRRFPLGPIAAITPFNFPLNLVAHKLAPAIAAGCTVVLKPAPQTPFTSFLLGEVIESAGWPAGALNILPLSNADAETMVADDRLKMLTFTGSGKVGWMLKAKAGKKKLTLELGGNAAVIVHGDADIEFAAELRGGWVFLRWAELHIRAANLRPARRGTKVHRRAVRARRETRHRQSPR
jgi:acyl-CoA reductase-like NAD-dependent aldehyde dehydrogenase